MLRLCRHLLAKRGENTELLESKHSYESAPLMNGWNLLKCVFWCYFFFCVVLHPFIHSFNKNPLKVVETNLKLKFRSKWCCRLESVMHQPVSCRHLSCVTLTSCADQCRSYLGISFISFLFPHSFSPLFCCIIFIIYLLLTKQTWICMHQPVHSYNIE